MYVNLTPHNLTVKDSNGKVQTVPSSGIIARIQEEDKGVFEHEGFMVKETKVSKVVNLPESKEGVFYIVSRMLATHPDCLSRDDILVPGQPDRDNKGKAIFKNGVNGFERLSK